MFFYIYDGCHFSAEVENTGSSHQFYEKFNVRYHISVVMKFIWENPVHRQKIKEESSSESFVRFINLLLNDTTFLLDESLTMLGEIHKTQEKMKDEAAWNALPEVLFFFFFIVFLGIDLVSESWVFLECH